MKILFTSLCFPALLLAGPAWLWISGEVKVNAPWHKALRHSAGLAPEPAVTPEAVVQVYAARAFRWRGVFAVHTWIATKQEHARRYRVHQVNGWRARRGQSAVVSRWDVPDRHWYGNRPEVIGELRGAAASAAIAQVESVVAAYPLAGRYTLWPGPNSNSFVAHVVREVPALRAVMPVTAIGKDYLLDAGVVGAAPSGTGYQLSVFGLFGLLLAKEEGVELNILGLSIGFDILDAALLLPGLGRVELW
jgi:hypothetical protein